MLVVPEHKMLYIVGSPRSGTTLLARLLTSHPQVHIQRETGFLCRSILTDQFTFDQPLGEDDRAQVWRMVRRRLRGEGWSEPHAKELLATAPNLLAFHRALCTLDAAAGTIWIGDNTPRYVQILSELFRLDPGARAIVLLRDPRATVASITKLPFGAFSIRRAAADWAYDTACGLAAHWAFPDRIQMIHYEALVSDTPAILSTAADKLGVRNDFDCHRVDHKSASIAVSLKHHSRLAGPVDQSRIEAWRDVLKESDLKIIARETGGLASCLGYEVEPSCRATNTPSLWRDAAVETAAHIRASGWKSALARFRDTLPFFASAR